MRSLDRLIFFFLCMLVFVLPASKAGVSIFSVLTILTFLIKKGAQAVVYLRSSPRPAWRFDPRAGRLLIALAAVVIINLLAVVWSELPDQSLKAFLSKVLEHVFLYLAAREVLGSSRRLKTLVGVLIVSAGILSVDALFQFFSGTDIFKDLPLVEGRVTASFSHANGLGAYLVIALSVLFSYGLFLWEKTAVRLRLFRLLALLLTGGLGATVLVMTYSRGAWIGFLAAALLLVLIRRRYAGILFALMVCFFLVGLPFLQATRNVSLVTDTVSTGKNEAASGSRSLAEWFRQSGMTGTGRVGFWQDAVRIIKDHPLTGTGLNTYTNTIQRYSDAWKAYPHNSYLQMSAEIGLPGVLVFFLFVIFHMMYAARVVRGGGPDASIIAGIMAGIFGFLVHAFFDTTLYSVQHPALFWILLGSVAAALGQKGPGPCKLTK
ncbi:MAG: hypothetical protein GX606_01030 [Elusimicrobia bacterium]|nr:hypothetical protein [Elusimicrobiota bacterium]